MPGVGTTMYTHPAAKRNSTTSTTQHDPTPQPQQQTPQATSQPQQYFSNSQNFGMFTPSQQMPPPMLSTSERSMSGSNMMQQSPITANFNLQPPIQSPTVSRDTQSSQGMQPPGWSGMAGALFDDPSLFNFDIASMNFGSNYGALEFGMLDQMAMNVGDTPPSDTTTTRGSVHQQQYRVPHGSFSESPNGNNFPYNDPSMMSDWPNGFNNQLARPPHAFAIESTAQFQSPEHQQHTPDGLKFEESPLLTSAAMKHPHQGSIDGNIQPRPPSQHQQQPQQPVQPTSSPIKSRIPPHRDPTGITTPQLKAKQVLPTKPLSNKPGRTRDPSSIYTSVTTPHPYTQNFHHLIAYLQRRFTSQHSKTLSIAKSLASIRPSFIATTKTLNRDDLIFMEKCFQRTLFEYESFIEGVGTPTIVARRTGEVAAVGKEFQILTGWTKNVLLGRAPNLNVNRGHTGLTPMTGSGANSASVGAGTATGKGGFNTPQRTTVAEENGDARKDRPVFLAELLDDDSVVQFYEDFARLAFGDSRGSVFRKGKLLKYRTSEEQVSNELRKEAEQRRADGRDGPVEPAVANTMQTKSPQHERHSSTGHGQLPAPRGELQGPGQGLTRRDTMGLLNPKLRKEGISGEKGMQKLGSADGKVDCAYCWTVKRDVFDIPMLIVMNVSVAAPFASAKMLADLMDLVLALHIAMFPVMGEYISERSAPATLR
jgi:hypothetical protein